MLAFSPGLASTQLAGLLEGHSMTSIQVSERRLQRLWLHLYHSSSASMPSLVSIIMESQRSIASSGRSRLLRRCRISLFARCPPGYGGVGQPACQHERPSEHRSPSVRTQARRPTAVAHRRTHLPALSAHVTLTLVDVPLDGIRFQVLSQLLQDPLQGIEPAGEVVPVARKLT